MAGVYQEIVEPVFEVLTTVTFAKQGGKTKQKLQARVIMETARAAPYLAGMERAGVKAWSALPNP